MHSTTPLSDALARHIAKSAASFHTPGHKGQAGLLRGLDTLTADLTELPDTGSLYDGDDAIEEAERLAADAFGARLTLFSAGGCTLCLQTMLYLGAGPGSTVVMARNAHVRAVDACALLDIKPRWAWPAPGGQITPAAIAAALEAAHDVRAVYVTSPDYYGRLADIPAIAALCRQAGVPLLVDNAHGSHLGAFDRHPLTLGAAMTADSAHKTLPVLTGGAMLHIGDAVPAVDRTAAKAAMGLFGSTSPSFPVLASLDRAADWWRRAGRQAFGHTAAQAAHLAALARDLKLDVIRGDDTDPARLTLDTAAAGISGIDAAAYFREQGCEPEFADERAVVFILTPFNTPADLSRLEQAVRVLPAALRRGFFWGRRAPAAAPEAADPPVVDCTPAAAIRAPAVTVPLDEAVGRTAARTVCPCPPGIPLVVAGETIDNTVAAALARAGRQEVVVTNRL